MYNSDQSLPGRIWRSGKMLLYLSNLMFTGIFLLVVGGQELVADRWPSFPYRGYLHIAELLVYGWMIIVLWPREISKVENDLAGFALCCAVLSGVFAYYRQHDWAIIGFSATIATALWAVGEHRGRSYILGFGGWLMGGIEALMTRWPSEQRFDVLLMIGGVATAVQGALEMPHQPRRIRNGIEIKTQL